MNNLRTKILLLTTIFTLLLCTPARAIVEGNNYFQIYQNLPDIKIEFIHNEDPDEYYDYEKFHFSPYPLIRISSEMYVKNITIPSGYYLLTPRDYMGKPAVLFKQKGKVKFIIPAYEKTTIDPKVIYKIPPKPKTVWWKWSYKWLPWLLGKIIPANRYNQNPNMPNTLVDAYDLDMPFYAIDVYYEENLYRLIFKKSLN